MKISTKTTFVTASTVAAFLLLLFKGGVATGTMMSGGVMKIVGVSGTGWFLVSCLIFIALAATIFSVIFWKKHKNRRGIHRSTNFSGNHCISDFKYERQSSDSVME
jgi:hypothetical protein